MAANQTEITRDALARMILRLVVVLAGATIFIVIFQRPLGITADGVRTAERILFASLVIALPVTRFFFTRPRFPRNAAKRKSV